MGPEKASKWTMRVRLFIGMLVMPPVYPDPASWGILDTAQTKEGKGVFQPLWAGETTVGQHTMKA